MSLIFGQLVIGPPGSGKTTYCNAMCKFLEQMGRKVAVINIGMPDITLIRYYLIYTHIFSYHQIQPMKIWNITH